MPISSSNRIIVKNTFLLYIRQFFTLGLSLYTSRITLEILGATDFGIYAVVGGITALLSIITSSMSTCTQRFMTYELGSNNYEKLNKVYITSVQIHLLLSIILLIAAETIGVWFVNNKLSIPVDRANIAFYVFQLSTFSCILSLLNVPNQALIVAHEDMGIFSIFSIVEALLKLIFVVALCWITWDKLLTYALCLFLIQLLNRVASIIYSHYRYSEARYKNLFDIELSKSMFRLAGWNAISNISVMGFIQGVNILLNMFFGPVLNAAYTIAMQAYSGIRSFCSSFQLASNPQIVKAYSIGDFERMHSLLITVCKMSFFLILFISLPFLINAKAMLGLWLGEVPEHTTAFFSLLLLYAYLDIFAYPMDIAAQATGKVQKYNTLTSLYIITTLPISYILYLYGAIPEAIYIVAIIMSFIGLIARIICLGNLIHLNRMRFFKQVIVKSVWVGILSSMIPVVISILIDNSLYRILSTFTISFISTGICVYLIGLNNNERKVLKGYYYKFRSKPQGVNGK